MQNTDRRERAYHSRRGIPKGKGGRWDARQPQNAALVRPVAQKWWIAMPLTPPQEWVTSVRPIHPSGGLVERRFTLILPDHVLAPLPRTVPDTHCGTDQPAACRPRLLARGPERRGCSTRATSRPWPLQWLRSRPTAARQEGTRFPSR